MVNMLFRSILMVVWLNTTNTSLKVSDDVVRVRDQSQGDLFADEPEELDLLVPISAQTPPIGDLVSFIGRVSWILDRKLDVVILATATKRNALVSRTWIESLCCLNR